MKSCMVLTAFRTTRSHVRVAEDHRFVLVNEVATDRPNQVINDIAP